MRRGKPLLVAAAVFAALLVPQVASASSSARGGAPDHLDRLEWPAAAERASTQRPASLFPDDVGEAEVEAAGSLTVSPSVDLVHGQPVDLRLQGWTAGQRVFAVQCAPGVPRSSTCEYLGDGRVGATGGLTLSVRLDVIVDTAAGPADCRVVACRVVVGAVGPQRASTVAFDPAGPDPARHGASASPVTDLVDGQEVEVIADGVPIDGSFPWFSVRLCRVPALGPADCDASLDYSGFVLIADPPVRTLWLPAVLHLPGGTHDCRTAGCVLAVGPEDLSSVDGRGELSEAALLPVTFDPAAPLRPPPTLTAHPADDLVDGDVVRLVAREFIAGAGLTILQCRADPEVLADCQIDGSTLWGYFGVDPEPIRLRTSVRTRFPVGSGRIDCRVDECVLAVIEAAGGPQWELGRHAVAATGFDPDGRLLAPTLEVVPDRGLADGDSITVRGQGWPPMDLVGIRQCVRDQPWVCAEEVVVPEAAARTTGSGTELQARYTVRATLPTGGSPLACGGDRCEIVAEGLTFVRRVPISFGVDAPVAAAPTFTG